MLIRALIRSRALLSESALYPLKAARQGFEDFPLIFSLIDRLGVKVKFFLKRRQPIRPVGVNQMLQCPNQIPLLVKHPTPPMERFPLCSGGSVLVF